MQVLQAHQIVIAPNLDQGFCRVASTGKELGVGAAVGDAEDWHCVERNHFLQIVNANVDRRRVKFGVEPISARDIEHRVNRILTHPSVTKAYGLVAPQALKDAAASLLSSRNRQSDFSSSPANIT